MTQLRTSYPSPGRPVVESVNGISFRSRWITFVRFKSARKMIAKLTGSNLMQTPRFVAPLYSKLQTDQQPVRAPKISSWALYKLNLQNVDYNSTRIWFQRLQVRLDSRLWRIQVGNSWFLGCFLALNWQSTRSLCNFQQTKSRLGLQSALTNFKPMRSQSRFDQRLEFLENFEWKAILSRFIRQTHTVF